MPIKTFRENKHILKDAPIPDKKEKFKGRMDKIVESGVCAQSVDAMKKHKDTPYEDLMQALYDDPEFDPQWGIFCLENLSENYTDYQINGLTKIALQHPRGWWKLLRLAHLKKITLTPTQMEMIEEDRAVRKERASA